jgi:diketogulonate reductase-like aldo/keto reductase
MNITLNNGVVMPAIGLGVFQTPPEVTTDAVATALKTGYRHIDTAAAYFNEREVGEGIRRSGIDRSEIFIETKVWISDYGYGQTLHAFDKSSRKLGVDQLDLFILHQPLPVEFDRTIDAYRALEQLLEDGRVRAIGVSNFKPQHLRALGERTSVVPAVNQIEVPLLHAARRAKGQYWPRYRHPGLVTHRRHHLLPRRQREEHVQRPHHPRHRRTA